MSHLHLLNHTWAHINTIPLLFKISPTFSLRNNVSNRPHPNTIELVTPSQCNSSLCQTTNCTLFNPRMSDIHTPHTNTSNNHGTRNGRLPNTRNSRRGGHQLRICRHSYLYPISIRTNNNLFPISHIRTKCNLFPITHDSSSLLLDTQGVVLRAVLQASRLPWTTQGLIIRPAPHRLHQRVRDRPDLVLTR